MADEVETPEVGLTINEGLPEKKEGQAEPEKGVDDVDDLVTGDDNPEGKETPKKEKKDGEEPPADKGEKKVETAAEKALREENAILKEKKKNLERALHQERQGKKATAKEGKDETPLNDDQLIQILRDNPDPETQLRVARYVANLEAKKAKDIAIADVGTSQRSRAMNQFLSENYPSLYEDGSETRTDIDSVKVNLGIVDHPYGDFFAVGTRVLENLSKITKDAYERGKQDALAGKAEENRGKKIEEASLTPKGKGTGGKNGVEGLTKEQRETAKQMGMTPSQLKIYAQLTGKAARTVSVED